MERSDIVSSRVTFLQKIKKYRENSKNIVCLDETFVHSSHRVPKRWQYDDVALNVPLGNGERFIAWDPGAIEVFRF